MGRLGLLVGDRHSCLSTGGQAFLPVVARGSPGAFLPRASPREGRAEMFRAASGGQECPPLSPPDDRQECLSSTNKNHRHECRATIRILTRLPPACASAATTRSAA